MTKPSSLRNSIIFTLLLIVVLVATGCLRPEESTIKLGILLPMTGNGHQAAAAHLSSVQEHVDTINRSGGINGRKLVLIVGDTESAKEQTLIEIKRMMEIDYCYAILYPFHSGFSSAVSYSINISKTPVIYYGNTDIPEKDINSWSIILKDISVSENASMDIPEVINISEENLDRVFKLLKYGSEKAGVDKARMKRYILEELEKTEENDIDTEDK